MLIPGEWGDKRKMRIGLLGGSFNPPHEGHLHLSLLAKNKLSLDQVWWLVTPQNPLKKSFPPTPIQERFKNARALQLPAWLHLTELESTYGTVFTFEILRKLKIRFPNAKFVWLMGADNLVQLSSWMNWSEIFNSVRIAVFDREAYKYKSIFGKAATKFRSKRVSSSRALALWRNKFPSWVFFSSRKNNLSSTKVRLLKAKL